MTHHWGYVGAITAAVLFGVSSTLNKIVLSDVNPVLTAGLIYLIAGVALFAVRLSPLNRRILHLLETPTETEREIRRKDYAILALVILSGSFIAPFLFMHGLNETTAVNTSLLLNTEAVFTAFIALAFLGERAARKDYLGMALVVVGAVFVTTSGEFGDLRMTEGLFGSLLVVAACLFWGLDNNLSKFLSVKRDIILITALKCSSGGALLLALSALMGMPFYLPLWSLPYIFTVGAFSIGFSIMFFLFALREIGAMKTGVIFSSSSLIGAVFAFAVLSEPFTAVQALAGIAMLSGIYMLYME